MTESDSQSYFLAIEDFFVDLRGAPLLLSPTDWRVVKEWHRREIPLEVVKDTLEELIERRRQKNPKTRISSLKYFDRAIRKKWSDILDLQAPALGERKAEAIDVRRRLRSLSQALPARSKLRPLAERLNALDGEPDAVEAHLEDLDRELVETVFVSLSSSERSNLEAVLEAALDPLRQRISKQELEAARRQIRDRLLREKFDLPLLSLFGEEAITGKQTE